MTILRLDTDPSHSGSSAAQFDREAGRTFVGGFETTYLPSADVDVAESTGILDHWGDHLDALQVAGITRLRYPLRWHRIAHEPGTFDWSATDSELEAIRERGLEPIIDLVHHTSYPAWLSAGFGDARFPGEMVRFAEAAAERYPWLPAYTLFNEPFATLFLAGHQAIWPPYYAGMEGFARLATAVLPAISAAAEIFAEGLPDAEHVWIDTCEAHRGTPGAPAEYARLADDRRHLLLDLALGVRLDRSRPALAALLAAGGESLLELHPLRVDVLGLDYYPHSEWWYTERGGMSPSPHPRGFASVARDYHERYRLPMMLSETNVRGLPSDRATWLRYMLDEYRTAVRAGLPMTGFTWFPMVDSTDWDSLLARPARRRDPVGVRDVTASGRPVRTAFTRVWENAAAGCPVEELPAYRLQPPCDVQLRGFFADRQDWPWQDPPNPVPPTSAVPVARDLVVLSHLRWDWVWQRPQHLVTRFAADLAARGARTWFVEEPVPADVSAAEVTAEQSGDITRVRMVVPRPAGHTGHMGFQHPAADAYASLLSRLFAEEGVVSPDVLMYTPMALDILRSLDPHRIGYDVMDDLASFTKAPDGVGELHSELLDIADVVFAGGRSLHRSVSQRRPDCHLFASGVDVSHFRCARDLRRVREGRGPVAGYVGVLDERVDLDLVAALAAALPEWTIRMVGPLAKISREELPTASNIEYPGMAAYTDLPAVMADFDVALMPFALNEATRAISPTKTLEYLAAGLPVVSTRVADVVADYSEVVCLADTAVEFAEACARMRDDSLQKRDQIAQRIQDSQGWDAIARAMGLLLEASSASPVRSPVDEAHRAATGAAMAGIQDPALGSVRLRGPMLHVVAEAAVSSATPFLRAPLLSRLAAVQRHHPLAGDDEGTCPSCGVTAPCPTATACA